MSAIGSWFARAIAAVGGSQTAAIVLVAGLVVGGAGGALIASNSRGGGSGATATVSVYPCPNQGPALLTIANGDQLLVTGRLADDSWVRIHLPTPGRTEGWVEAGPLTVNGSVDSLPVATCAAEAGAPSPAVPDESLTAIVNATPSPAPTTLGPSPTPSPSPTASSPAGPALASLAASAQTISYDPGSYCRSAVKTVTISVKASDAAGIAGVTLFWRAPGASSISQAAMSRSKGSATSGSWQATLNTTANGLTAAGSLAYYVVATNAAGATSRIPSSGASTIAIAVCANKGPTIASVASASGSLLYWNPLGASGCPTSTSNITAVVSDTDGVKSVTLFYRRPGASVWSSKPMNNHTIPGKWFANLDTLGDSIKITQPPTGTLSWYVKAVDAKNASSQSRTGSITIRRCDSPARFTSDVLKGNYPFSPPSNAFKLVWTVKATDPDGLKSATLAYTITNGATGAHESHKITVNVAGKTIVFTSGPLAGKTYVGSDEVTWTITTTDKYGGKSTTSSKATVFVG
jgi:hypothetical protein